MRADGTRRCSFCQLEFVFAEGYYQCILVQKLIYSGMQYVSIEAVEALPSHQGAGQASTASKTTRLRGLFSTWSPSAPLPERHSCCCCCCHHQCLKLNNPLQDTSRVFERHKGSSG